VSSLIGLLRQFLSSVSSVSALCPSARLTELSAPSLTLYGVSLYPSLLFPSPVVQFVVSAGRQAGKQAGERLVPL
jgi:hypothetical protein